MYQQNYRDIYNRYTSQFPELSYNFCQPQVIYPPPIVLQNYSQYGCVEDERAMDYPVEDEQSKETYDEWVQEHIIEQSQINIIETQYATEEYEHSSQTSSRQYNSNPMGESISKQVSRRYLDKFYENSNYNSEITSESKSSTSSEGSALGEDYESSEKSGTQASKLENDTKGSSILNNSSKESKLNNFGSTDISLAENLKENIENVLIESRLQRFDRLVTAELKRQRNSEHIMLEPVTSNAELIKAVNHLVHAESADMFNGALKAAEEAASKVPPEKAEEAAVAGAREYQAEVTDFINESVDGWIPIKVMGYVGITRPKLPTKS